MCAEGPCTRAKIVKGGVFIPTSSIVQSANLLPLIASAPEMLAMLRQEIENFDDGIHGRRLRHSPMELNRAARALLARVERETR